MCEKQVDGWDKVRMAWSLFGMLAVALVVGMALTAITMSHTVTRYYAASDGTTQNSCKWIPEKSQTICNTPTCIWADVSWSADSKVYCGNDPDAVIEQLKQLNATVK